MLVKSRDDNLRGEEYVGTKIDGVYLDNVNNYNYVGVIVKNKLTFTDFVENKYTKANLRVYHLKKMCPFIYLMI